MKRDAPRRWRFLLLGAGFLGILATLPADASADIYRWTDKNGVVHFSNEKGPGAELYIKSSPQKKKKSAVTPVMPSDRNIDRFTRYNQWIREAATLYQIPEELIRAVIKVESDYDPRAVSSAGAQGLMQLMPATALRMQIRDSFDPRLNIFGGVRYLRVLANHFNGNLELTIAGYNAGEGAVMRYGGIPPYEETQHYVTKVLYFYHRFRTTGDVVAASQGG